MICHGETEFMKNYSTSMGLKAIQAFSSNVLMALLQCFIVFTTWESFGKIDKINLNLMNMDFTFLYYNSVKELYENSIFFRGT